MEAWNVEDINSYFVKNIHPDRVSCHVTDEKGRVLVACQPFKKGEVIFEERPLHIVKADQQNDAYKRLSKLCKQFEDDFVEDPLWYWAALCSLTKDDLGQGPKKGSLPTVDTEVQQRLLCLYHEQGEKASKPAEILVREFRLKASEILVSRLIQVWILNCFDHSENPPGFAAYFGASFMSHSCHPNAIWHFAEGTTMEDTYVLRARREILPGDEICISYLHEGGLLYSAVERKATLKRSKNFTCTCERCGPNINVLDITRGFRCPTCFKCAVFHPLKEGELFTAVCGECQSVVGEAESKRLLEAEAQLKKRLNKLDSKTEKQIISKVLKEPDVQELLRSLGDSSAGSVGPQHWLCERVWSHLSDWYNQTGRGQDAYRMILHQVAYQRQVYSDLQGQLAWTLEALAELLLSHAGLSANSVRLAGLDDAAVKRMVIEAKKALDEAAGILQMLFGCTHSYFVDLDKKRARVAEFLETGKWPIMVSLKSLKRKWLQ